MKAGKLRGAGVALFLLAAMVSLRASAGAPLATAEDLGVLQAALCPLQGADTKSSVVADIPADPRRYHIPAEWLSSALEGQLGARTQTAAQWPQGKVCAGVRIVDGKEVDAIFAQDKRIPPSWEGFRARFPDARSLIRFALPAFSDDGKLAIVYFETTCDPLCGTGFYIELARAAPGSQWRITNKQAAWIS